MQTLTTLILEKELATLGEIEAAVVHQVLHGGHLGTNLVELGTFKEPELQRLLSDQFELPVGPQGRLPRVTGELEDYLEPALAERYRVVPVRRTDNTLHLAAASALTPAAEEALAKATGMSIRVLVVTPLRLGEALHRWCDTPLSERDRWLLELLNAGRSPSRDATYDARVNAAALFPQAAVYRRMSEHPSGISPSERQPKPRRGTPPLGVQAVTQPDGLGESTLTPGESRPSGVDSSHAPISSQSASSSMAPASDAPEEPNRITRPYTEDEDEDEDEQGADLDDDDDDDETEGKRNTQPWRDDNAEPDGPISMPNEFRSSLGDEHSDEAKIHEEHRHFRHRGPFTRAQAELAVSQATEVNLVLEILVRYARQFFERCILFVVTETHADLRLAYGLGMELAGMTLPLEHDGVLAEAWTEGDPVMRALHDDGMDAIVRDKLHVDGDQKVAVIPLCIRERVVALFYGDDRGESVDKSAVADVTDFTEICAAEVTRIIVSRKRPS